MHRDRGEETGPPSGRLQSVFFDHLANFLSEIFGNGISFKVQKGIEKESKSSGINIKKNSTDSENDEQVRDKVVDLFDGEILTQEKIDV